MRPTWIVLGIVLVVGAIAYLKVMDTAGESETGAASSGEGTGTGATPSLQRTDGAVGRARAATPAPDAAAQAVEKRATTLLGRIAKAHEVKDRAGYDQAVSELRSEAWDAPAARRFAVKLGWGTLEEARRHQGAERMQRLDEARRLLSRGVYLDDAFAKDGQPTPERTQLVQAIQQANAEVMSFGRRSGGGLEGVTEVFEVPPGWVPVIIVSRRRLPYGHNVLLYWNHRGNLDPRRLRAGERLLLPKEPISVHVHLRHHLLGLFLGDWFVKEFRVGVGRAKSPTPVGSFVVGSKMENPDWWGPAGHVPPLDPKNELGSAWIPISGPTLPDDAGIGIHGTNRPPTVGTDCSNGCVRLLNEEASELFWWVRTGSAGGTATPVVVYP